MREEVEQFDVIIIGAGVTGLYALYRLRARGLSVRAFEEGGGVGGIRMKLSQYALPGGSKIEVSRRC